MSDRISVDSPLRVVFFGPRQSGKTDLLKRILKIAGNVKRVPRTPEPDLFENELAKQDPTRRQPLDLDLAEHQQVGDFLLIDCDGEKSAELLSRQDLQSRLRTQDAFARQIGSADVLLVIVDANSQNEQVQETYGQAKAFIDELNRIRRERREVGGMPVILTLTKCDQLYDPKSDDVNTWLRKIHREKLKLQKQFEAYFQGEARIPTELEEGFPETTDFGSIQLYVEETARELPPGRMFFAYDDGMGGFRTHELHALIRTVGTAYRKRISIAQRRLQWSIIGSGLILLMMFLTLAVVSTLREPSQAELLAERIRTYRFQEQPPEVRLAEKNFPGYQADLEAFRTSPVFYQLPKDLKDFVLNRTREFQSYAKYHDLFQPPQFSPNELRTKGEFLKLTADLNNKLAPPAEYAADWQKTEAAQLRQKWIEDLDLFKKHEEQLHDWYRSLIRRATSALLIETPTLAWEEQIAQLLRDAADPPLVAGKPVTGSRILNLRRGRALSSTAVYQFERIEAARRDWEFASAKLTDLRDLCQALGMTPSTEPERAVLRLPAPRDFDTSLTEAQDRLTRLEKFFPRTLTGEARWQANSFPDPIRQELAQRLKVNADMGVRHLRLLIRTQLALPARKLDQPADWTSLREKLLLRKEVQDWGRFLMFLLKWSEPDRGDRDPVLELAKFLEQPRWEITLESAEVFIPSGLKVERLAPQGALSVAYVTDQGFPRSIELQQVGKGTSTASGISYRFVPEGGRKKWDFVPGQDVSAALGVKSETNQYKLTWYSSRTASYKIDRLTREPRIENLGQPAAAQRATGVTVTWFPKENGLAVPELLPDLLPE